MLLELLLEQELRTSMFCLESKDEMPAQDEEVIEAKDEGVVVNNGWGLKANYY